MIRHHDAAANAAARRVSLLALALMLFGTAPIAAVATASDVAQFTSLLNAERTKRSLSPLKRISPLDAVAQRHTERMHRDGDIYHNRNLANEIPGAWTRAGENVGVAYSVDALHRALMASSDHRRNILGTFQEVGIGVIVDESGEVFVTQDFVHRGSTTKKVSSTKTHPSSKPEAAATALPKASAPPKTLVDRDHAVELLLRIMKGTGGRERVGQGTGGLP